MIPEQSRRLEPPHPPPRTPYKSTRPAIPEESRAEPRPSVGPSSPSSSISSSTRKPETARSSFPALPPPPQTRAPVGTQSSDTSHARSDPNHPSFLFHNRSTMFTRKCDISRKPTAIRATTAKKRVQEPPDKRTSSLLSKSRFRSRSMSISGIPFSSSTIGT